MYFRDGMIETLIDMKDNGEFDRIITSILKYRKQFGCKRNWFERRKEAKEAKKFYEALKSMDKDELHWIPVLYNMPTEVMRDLISIMASKYLVYEIGYVSYKQDEDISFERKK